MKKLTPLLVLLMIALFLSGCTGKAIENVKYSPELIQDVIELTDKAIEKNDVELARKIWSSISEAGVKAKEIGEEELAESLAKAASSYVHLIEYLQKGDEKDLAKYRDCFEQALEKIEVIESR